MKSILSLSIALLFLNNVFSQKQTLQLNLTKDHSYVQNFVSDMTIVQDVSGQEMTIGMLMSFKTVFKVLEAKTTGYEVDVKYDNISLKMDIPGQQGNAKLDEMMNMMTRAMKGKSFQMTITKKGKVTDIRNIETVFTGLFDSIPQINEEQKEQFAKQMKDAYGGDAFKSNFEMISSVFPAYAVGKGDSWVTKNKMGGAYNSDIETRYVLSDIRNNNYYLTATSTIGMNNNDSFKMTSGMPMKVSLSGNASSEMTIDKTTGWVIEGKMDQNLEGNTEIGDCAQVPGGMKIPMKMKNAMKITQ